MTAHASANETTPDVDNNHYLEDLRSKKSLEWVSVQNKRTINQLFSGKAVEHEILHDELLQIFDDKNRKCRTCASEAIFCTILARRRARERDLAKNDVGGVQEVGTGMGNGVGRWHWRKEEGKSWVYKGANFCVTARGNITERIGV